MAVRHLRDAEINEAKKVFQGTIHYDRVHISNVIGAGSAPFTVPTPGLIPLVTSTQYVINAGNAGYSDMLSSQYWKDTLIHELVHVWQGEHSLIAPMYVLNSLVHQGIAIATTGDRNNAYNYTPGAAWDSYNVEQQAKIVEDWYADGMKTSSPLYRYVSTNIQGHAAAGAGHVGGSTTRPLMMR